MLRILRRILIGRPLHNMEMAYEKMPKWKALATFSSDALSSVAYGPEQIMITLLIIPGMLTYGYFAPVSLAILFLLAVITISYIQVARANPGGGGSYAVATKNLGEYPALTAAAALFADYILTVAVSVSAGTAAIISAFPFFSEFAVLIDLIVLFGILMIINLRGVKDSANTFVFPIYAFIFGVVTLIITGIYQAFIGSEPVIAPEAISKQSLNWSILLLGARAFANGCSSMTGIEAISNGVPTFQKPEIKNAVYTTYWMSSILAIMFVGISFLMMHYYIRPIPEITALSQIAEKVFGRSWMYYYIQITTMLVLYLAANTSFNGLPPLLSILAKDGYMPRYLAMRGERLGFSNGIILLSIIAGLLIFTYKGDTEHLISLYAIGVFLSFTIAQSGMVIHWKREKNTGWVTRAIVNAIGAIITAIVVVIILVTKFLHGAWLVVIFIPFMIFIFKKIRLHHINMSEQLSLPLNTKLLNHNNMKKGKNIVIVPIASPTRVVAETIYYAKMISNDEIIALHIATSEENGLRVREKWEKWHPDNVKLVTVHSGYRLVIQPLIDYIEKMEEQKNSEDYITVLIPEFETKEWWHRLLHNQTGWILRTLLILKENVVVATIPYHLKK